jgi:hypothetical protein
MRIWGPYEVWTIVGVCIGTAGFHGPRREGGVEIGYGIAAGHRGRGLATEAAGRSSVWRVVTGFGRSSPASMPVVPAADGCSGAWASE